MSKTIFEGAGSKAPALVAGRNTPPGFVDIRVRPFCLPVADRSDGFLLGIGPDREHARLAFVPEAEELRLAFHQLLTGFLTTEKRCHPVCVAAFQHRQITNRPRLQRNSIRHGSTLCAIAHIGRYPHAAQRAASELPAIEGRACDGVSHGKLQRDGIGAIPRASRRHQLCVSWEPLARTTTAVRNVARRRKNTLAE